MPWRLFKTAIFSIVAPGTVGVLGPQWVRNGAIELPVAVRVLGLALLLMGVAIYLWCAWDFRDLFGEQYDEYCRKAPRWLLRVTSRDLGALVLLALGVFVHTLTNGPYGFHRDELLTMSTRGYDGVFVCRNLPGRGRSSTETLAVLRLRNWRTSIVFRVCPRT